MLSPPAARRIDRQPAGLSITIASASMNRMRSKQHRVMNGAPSI